MLFFFYLTTPRVILTFSQTKTRDFLETVSFLGSFFGDPRKKNPYCFLSSEKKQNSQRHGQQDVRERIISIMI